MVGSLDAIPSSQILYIQQARLKVPGGTKIPEAHAHTNAARHIPGETQWYVCDKARGDNMLPFSWRRYAHKIYYSRAFQQSDMLADVPEGEMCLPTGQ